MQPSIQTVENSLKQQVLNWKQKGYIDYLVNNALVIKDQGIMIRIQAVDISKQKEY